MKYFRRSVLGPRIIFTFQKFIFHHETFISELNAASLFTFLNYDLFISAAGTLKISPSDPYWPINEARALTCEATDTGGGDPGLEWYDPQNRLISSGG